MRIGVVSIDLDFIRSAHIQQALDGMKILRTYRGNEEYAVRTMEHIVICPEFDDVEDELPAYRILFWKNEDGSVKRLPMERIAEIAKAKGEG